MEWTVDFAPAVDKTQVKLIRDTLEAKLQAETGNYGEAARILWELLVELRHAGERHWECVTMIHLGNVYRALRWSIAQALLEDALKLARSLKFSLAKMMALTQLGEMHCHWGKFRESLVLFEEALETPEAELPNQQRLILLDMAVAYEGLDEITAARELVEKAVAIGRRIGGPEIREDVAHLDRLRDLEQRHSG
jgi:tetratricopeptide (TPR) repeat protein